MRALSERLSPGSVSWRRDWCISRPAGMPSSTPMLSSIRAGLATEVPLPSIMVGADPSSPGAKPDKGVRLRCIGAVVARDVSDFGTDAAAAVGSLGPTPPRGELETSRFFSLTICLPCNALITAMAGFGLVSLSRMVSCRCLCFRWSMRACAADKVGGETLNLGEMGTGSKLFSRDRRRLRGLSGLRKPLARDFPAGDTSGGIC